MITPKKPGPKRKLVGGVRVTLYLDAATLAAAMALGDGNPSVGVRRKFKMQPDERGFNHD